MSSETVIEFKGVSKKYSKSHVVHNSLREQLYGLFRKSGNRKGLRDGEFWALKDISFAVAKGECIAICGHNGSGKSTILKLIANVTYPTLGDVRIKTKVAPLIELGAGFHNDLTGHENIYMNGTILGMPIAEIRKSMDQIVEFSGLRDFISVPVKKYSSGMNLRLAFSIAIHSSAEIYLFDEVLAVGDNQFKQKCHERIAQLKEHDKTVLIVSHQVETIQHVIDRIITLNDGEIL
jgi:ABC-type polysaccharide/polyol phosphate transport system ATPase subunit